MDSQAVARWLRGESRSVSGGILRVALMPLALVYGCVVAAWMRCQCTRALPAKVISIGNLEVGGTGKSVLVRWLGLRLQQRGARVLVLARGYGAAVGGGLDEEGAELQAAGLRVVQHPKRLAAGMAALAASPAEVVLLDDGAQHRAIQREVEILLFDAARPFGSGWPLPAGSLRGFLAAGPRPDLMVLTRCAGLAVADLERTRARLQQRYGAVPCIAMEHAPTKLLPSGGLGDLRGRRVFLISGIARPRAFRTTVEALGAVVVGQHAAADHHAWNRAELADLAARARSLGADILLTTGKDWAKLGAHSTEPSLRALEVQAGFSAADEAMIDSVLAGQGVAQRFAML